MQDQFSQPEAEAVVLVKTSGLAIASLVLGISGVLCGCVAGIPAIICGHIALAKIKEAAGALTGRGMAIAGLVLGYLSIVIFFFAILAGMLLPAVTAAREKARAVVCRNNLKQLSIACQSYIETHEDGKYYPTSLDELLDSGVLTTPELLTCPSDKNPVRTPGGRLTSYECIFDFASDRLTVDIPGDLIAIWDRNGIHRDGRNAVFLDAHTMFVTEEKFQQLMAQLKSSGVLTTTDMPR